MNASATTSRRHTAPWWQRMLRLLGAATGLVAAAPFSLAPAQNAEYRSAASAPAAWQSFAKELQDRFEQRLGADNEAAKHLQETVAADDRTSTQTIVVRTWITSGGRIERLEFDGIHEAAMAVSLRAALASVAITPPPADMLQPLHLRLSLRAGDQKRRDQ